jgi:endonuclease YncB( thermonuclease family)
MRLLLSIPIMFLFAPSAFAHGGGLNAEGCHNDRKRGGYHCHRASAPSKPKKRSNPVYATTPRKIYANCTQARDAGEAPLYAGDRGYHSGLDPDGDGIACEGDAADNSRPASNASQTEIGPVIFASAQQQRADLSRPIEGTATVIDGDTIQIGTARIRFFGIDAFEGEQACTNSTGQSYRCGEIATSALTGQVEGKLVSCISKGRDAYQRELGVCRAEATELSSWMAREGHALAYVKYSLDYISDEQAAKTNGAGAHEGTFEKPWEYRVSRRGGDAEAAKQNTPPSPNCTIKGNIRSDGTRIYHIPSDPSYDKVKPESWFCDTNEATRAGFRPAFRPQ